MSKGKIFSSAIAVCVLSSVFSLPQAIASSDQWIPEAQKPAISSDGKMLAYESNVSGKEAIWTAQRNGTNARQFIEWPDSYQLSPDWSPDGKYLLFESDRDADNFNIWRIDADGTNPIKLTSNSGKNENPRYSPDGTKIVFTSTRTGKREIWVMDADGINQKAVGLQSLRINSPDWSPDGTEIVFSGCTRPPIGASFKDSTCNLFKIALDASSAKQLTFGKGADWHPSWGGTGIVFTSSKAEYNLVVIDSEGSNMRQVTDTSELPMHPRWDHTTNDIIYSSSADIAVSDINGNIQKIIEISQSFFIGDLNKDSCVDRIDYDLLMTHIRDDKPNNLTYDLNRDRAVNRADARTLVGLFTNPLGVPCE